MPMGRSITERFTSFGRTSRIIGVDAARGVAVLGMFAAHVAPIPEFDWTPDTWAGLVDGRSSILFALLAGVSIALITGRTHPVSGRELSIARGRLVVRAFLILLVGVLLVLLGTNIAVILPYYAVTFVLVLPVLRWHARELFVLAGGIGVLMPVVLFVPQALVGGIDFGVLGIPIDLLATGYYPALLWVAFVLTGMGLGRLRLGERAVALRVLVAGAALMVIGYGSGALAISLVNPPEVPFGATPTTDPAALLTLEPHSGSPFEVVGSTGFALVVLAIFLLVPYVARWLIFPLAALGSMALTAYTVQIVAIAGLGIQVPGFEPDNTLTWFTLVALVGASAWALLLGRGPFERALGFLSSRAVPASPADRLDGGAGSGADGREIRNDDEQH